MENDILNKLWNTQQNDVSALNPDNIILKAKQQRNGQKTTIVILALTAIILIAYAISCLPNQWNSFSSGLIMMIASIIIRVFLEVITSYRKESKLVSMDNKTYYTYLKKYYTTRLLINYIITPICFISYLYGFYLLLPYFKKQFSQGFYTYIIVSGVVSLLVIAVVIIKSVVKEHQFLKSLNTKQFTSRK